MFRRSRAANSVVSGPIWLKFELVRDFMHVLVTCKYKKDRIKNNRKRWRHCFPHYKSMGAFCCHGNHSFDPICPKTLCRLSPTPVMLHIKFDQDWPIGFRDIQVWKCGRWTDGRTIGILEAHLVSLRLRWANNLNQRTSGPVNAHLTPGPGIYFNAFIRELKM